MFLNVLLVHVSTNEEANIILAELAGNTPSVLNWKDPDHSRKGNIEHFPVCSAQYDVLFYFPSLVPWLQ